MAINNANDHPFQVALVNAAEDVIYANSHPYKVALEDGKVGFEAVIVEELPETGETGNIYFILKESTPQGDVYDEYMWVLQSDDTYGWAHIGVTDTVEIKLYSSTGQNTNGAMTQKAVTTELNKKQNTLIAGDNIQIANDGKTISATDTTYTAGSGLDIEGTEFSVDTEAIQEKLTAGSNIQINGNTISATDTTYTNGSGLNLSGTEFSVDTTTIQEKLTFDNTPTANSNNPVTSQGIKTYVDNNKAFKPYPNTVRTNGTTEQFLNDIVALGAEAGTAYLGTVSLSDLPGQLIQEEVEAYVYNEYTVWAFLRSADTAPYQWWTCSYDYQGWTPFGKIYTAGTDIDITNDVISATNTGKAKLLTQDDYNYPTTGTKTAIALWLLPAGNYYVSNNGKQPNEEGFTHFKIHVSDTSIDYNVSTVIISAQSPQNSSSMTITTIDGSAGDNKGRVFNRTYAVDKRTGALNGTYAPLYRDDVVDNLTSTGDNVPLSANQGKILNDKIDGLIIARTGAPTSSTSGTKGIIWEDTTNGKLYFYQGVGTSGHIWVEVADASKMPTTLTDAQYAALWSMGNPLNDMLETIVSGSGV